MTKRLDELLHSISDHDVRVWMRKRMSDRDLEHSSFHTLFAHLNHPNHKTYERMLRGLMDEDGCTIAIAVVRMGKERFLSGIAKLLAEQDK
jgi:hypothetical protein